VTSWVTTTTMSPNSAAQPVRTNRTTATSLKNTGDRKMDNEYKTTIAPMVGKRRPHGDHGNPSRPETGHTTQGLRS